MTTDKNIEQNEPGAPERRVGPTIRCHFCKRLSCWVHAGTGRQVCSRCKALVAEANWDELARKSLKWYPDEWVSDVSAFLQMTFEGASFPESVVPLVVCEGCDGSLCGRAHSHRRVLPAATVVARNPKDAEG